MACANSVLTLFAAVILVFTFWPALISFSKWIIVASVAIIILITWTGLECRWCKDANKPRK